MLHRLREGLMSSSSKFGDGGVVGLGIVAAMNAGVAFPARSEPIPIVSAVRAVTASELALRKPPSGDVDEKEGDYEMEMLESYTRVTCRVRNEDSMKKMVYFDCGGITAATKEMKGGRHGGGGGGGGSGGGGGGLFYQSPPYPLLPPVMSPLLPPADFLSKCYLCRKSLDGIDVFMYRGERAFCSVECRCQQIMSFEHHENCGSEAMKHFDGSVSPCSAPLPFAAGVAAA